jgi:hypothetical protein
MRNTIAIAIAVISLALLAGYVAGKARSQPITDTQAIGLELRAIANRIEESNLPGKSDLAERVEALSAEVLAAQSPSLSPTAQVISARRLATNQGIVDYPVQFARLSQFRLILAPERPAPHAAKLHGHNSTTGSLSPHTSQAVLIQKFGRLPVNRRQAA